MIAPTRRPSDLFGELRRRNVVRVAAVYAAAAFAVLQVADIAFPALNLPHWATTSVVLAAFLGFPVAIAVGWFLERAETAVPTVPTGGPVQARSGREPAALAVIPFHVAGDREFHYLSEGIVDILGSKLRGGDVRGCDPHTLFALGAREVGSARDPARARALAERCGADLFVLGNIVEAGRRLHVQAALYGVRPGLSRVAEATVEGPAGELFGLVDDLARQLLTGLTSGPASRLTRLAVATTGSFEALKAYLEGEREMRAMRRGPAAEAYRRAVEVDPHFALAWYRLAVAALWGGQLERSRDAIERAAEQSERLSAHDRMLVDAFRAFVRGQAEEAERLYRTIVGNRPDDLEAWYQLAEVLFHYGPMQGRSISESRAAWERALSIEPDHLSALAHLAAIAAAENRRAEVEELVSRAAAISPDGDAVTWMEALRAWETGDAKAQREVLKKLRSASDFATARAAWYVSSPGKTVDASLELAGLLTERTRSAEVRAVGHLWLGHLELAKGRLGVARSQVAEAKRVHAPTGIVHEALLSLVPILERRGEELARLKASLEGWSADGVRRSLISGAYFTVHNDLYPQLRAYLLGLVSARLGDSEGARRYATALQEWNGRPEAAELARDQSRSISASLAFGEGRTADALATLEASCMGALFELSVASPFYSQARERWLRAELLHAAGRQEEALRWFGSFTGHCIYDLIYHAPAHYRRGSILAELGRLDEAAEHYRHFLEHWSGADAELRPWLERAREKLGALSPA